VSNHDDDFALPIPKQYPLVKPGLYIGVTATVRKKNYNGVRDYLVILFDLFESPETLGCGAAPIARGVPGFFNLDSGAASRYARLLQLLYPTGNLPKNAADLIGKAVEVEIVTVDHEQHGKPLPEVNYYSKVSEVVGHA
jgi:hypothetical protein